MSGIQAPPMDQKIIRGETLTPELFERISRLPSIELKNSKYTMPCRKLWHKFFKERRTLPPPQGA
jgi:hypothetical protein